MQLSEHFSFDELTTTSNEELLESNRVAAKGYMKQLKYTAYALEEIRSVLGVGMVVTSGFRSSKLNKEVGGSPTSKHTQGLCADFKPSGTMTVKDAFNLLMENKDKLHSVRKVIVEGVRGKEWIHMQAKVLGGEPLEFFSTNNGKTFTKVV